MSCAFGHIKGHITVASAVLYVTMCCTLQNLESSLQEQEAKLNISERSAMENKQSLSVLYGMMRQVADRYVLLHASVEDGQNDDMSDSRIIPTASFIKANIYSSVINQCNCR